jgi:hypothetical protein
MHVHGKTKLGFFSFPLKLGHDARSLAGASDQIENAARRFEAHFSIPIFKVIQ